MNSFYTNVLVWGGKILYRGVNNGKKILQKIDYSPTFFVPSKTETEYKTIYNEYVSPITPGNIRECKDFVKRYESVDGFPIYGNQRYEYCFISDKHSKDVDWNIDDINITILDIEVASENGFPNQDTASEEITAITFKTKKQIFVFGCDNFDNNRQDVKYIKCRDEIDLIKRFIDEWTANYPDVITGWNIKFFDIPYLVNRITKLLGEDMAKRLSPWNIITDREVYLGMNKKQTVYTLMGISNLDYIELYKKYAPEGKSQESYKLDSICNVEIGEKKLSYSEYGNLYTLYKENFQLFLEYNIKDVELIEKLDDKLKLIELALTLAYDSKTNYEDVFSQIRMWDILIFNHFRKKKMVLPPTSRNKKDEAYIGAYVKDPAIGLHNWIASFDLTSLYPSLIMQYNLSPETIINPKNYTSSIRNILKQNITIDALLNQEINTNELKENNITLTPNGQIFSIKKEGFMPEMTRKMFEDRQKYKKKMIQAQKELEELIKTNATENEKNVIIRKISKFNNLQLSKKVSLNSLYGAAGSPYFRFFDIRIATAVTTAGQLSIRWIENNLNQYMNKLLKTTDKDYVVASDTDSIYLSLGDLVNQTILQEKPNSTTKDVIRFLDKICDMKIQPVINNSYQNLAEYVNAYEQKMIMKREALADKGLWTAKKRYVLNVYNNEGVEYTKPKTKIMGLEIIKSSTPYVCRQKLKESIDVMFSGNENSMIEFIDEFRKEFQSLSPSDVAFPRGVNGLAKYADNKSIFGLGTPIHVRGSLIYNNLLKKNKLEKKYQTIKEGEKIKYLYLKEPNHIQSNIISFPENLPKEFDLEQYIDYNMQYEKTFIEPLKIMLNSIGWKTEKVSSLEDFFS